MMRRLNRSPLPHAPPRPSLLLISATYVIGENRKKLEALAEHFDLTCVTCTRARGFGMEIDLQKQSQPVGYRLIGLQALGNSGNTTRYILRGLRKVVRDGRANIILIEAEPWALIRWQAWLWKKVHRPHALFGEFSWENIERFGIKGQILRGIYRAAVATDDFVIAGNQDAKAILERRGMSASRLLVSPQLGVDETYFRPAEGAERGRIRAGFGFPPDAIVIGFCGRLEWEKGVPDLVRAVESLRANAPGRDIRLAIIGHGTLREQLGQNEAGGGWMRVFPARSHSEIAPFFQALDLFVLPSKEIPGVWKEQFGHVLIEAMACGVACVGSDSGAIPEVLGDNMLTFPAGDVPALTERLSSLIVSAEIGHRMRERVLRHFTNHAVAAQWAAFILSRLHDNKSQVDPLD